MEGLDTVVPYERWSVVSNNISDSPGDPLPGTDSYYYRRDKFKSYLLFKPTEGASLPVPLRIANWEWMGQAVLVNSNTFPEEYALHSHRIQPQAAMGVDCLDHPTWTNNAANYLPFRKWNNFWFYPASP